MAEPLLRKALAIRLKVLGNDHPETASAYNSLAANLDAQGRLGEAVEAWTRAADIALRTRGLRAVTGIEQSLTMGRSPAMALAVGLSRQGKPVAAWTWWENGLARGLLDDYSARRLRPLTREQRDQESWLVVRLQRIEEQITRFASQPRRGPQDEERLERLRRQQNALYAEFVEFQNRLGLQFQAYAGKPSSLDEVRAALPDDAALVGWIDVGEHHRACVLRRGGDPVWITTPGTGTGGAWTEDDRRRPAALCAGWRTRNE